jgi:hypothetical protein
MIWCSTNSFIRWNHESPRTRRASYCAMFGLRLAGVRALRQGDRANMLAACGRPLKNRTFSSNVRHSIDSSRRSDWARASQGGRPGPRAGFLPWRARLPIDAALRPRRCFHFGGRVSSPHRAQHVGKSGRVSTSARQHGTLPPGDSLSDAG